jgi:hypothetical protein
MAKVIVKKSRERLGFFSWRGFLKLYQCHHID